MLDPITGDYLKIILEAIDLIEKRFERMTDPEDFVKSTDGVTLLDSISMRLQVIGETVKKIDQKYPKILKKESGIEWEKIMKLRDIISHHYNIIDYEIVYDICENHVQNLKLAIRKMFDKYSIDQQQINDKE